MLAIGYPTEADCSKKTWRESTASIVASRRLAQVDSFEGQMWRGSEAWECVLCGGKKNAEGGDARRHQELAVPTFG